VLGLLEAEVEFFVDAFERPGVVSVVGERGAELGAHSALQVQQIRQLVEAARYGRQFGGVEQVLPDRL